MTAIVTVNPEQYGLEATEAKQVEAAFTPMLEKMTELEAKFNEVSALPMSDEAVHAARRLRLEYVKVRTGTAGIHKKLKAYHLAAGRFIDGWKNAQAFASQGKEDALESIEKHFENLEKERIARLAEEREAMLEPYGVTTPGLGTMDADVWENFLAGTKLRHEQRIEAERKADADRIAAEEAGRERIRLQEEENRRLKAEAEKREREIAAEREKAEKARRAAEAKAKKEREEAERKLRAEQEAARKEREAIEAKARAEREAAEAKARKEREAAEAEAWRIQAEAAARLKAEEEKRAAIERELQEKKEAEARAEAETGQTCVSRHESNTGEAIWYDQDLNILEIDDVRRRLAVNANRG